MGGGAPTRRLSLLMGRHIGTRGCIGLRHPLQPPTARGDGGAKFPVHFTSNPCPDLPLENSRSRQKGVNPRRKTAFYGEKR
jgi:hypothetical protein